MAGVASDTSTVRFFATVQLFQHLVNFYNYKTVFYSYCCRSLELKKSAFQIASDYQPFLTYQHWAGVSPYTLRFRFAETCVLVKQLLSVVC